MAELTPSPLSVTPELVVHLEGLGECGDMRLTPLKSGCQSVTLLCEEGPQGYPGKFVVQYPQDPERGSDLEVQYQRLRLLNGVRAPLALHLGRLLDRPVMCVEYVEGIHKDFNQLSQTEIEVFAAAVSEVHATSSPRFSCYSGQMPCTGGTHKDYLQAMLEESVTKRLWNVDMSLFPEAEPLISTGGMVLNDLLNAQPERFAGNYFTPLHHDLNPENVIWKPDGSVVFIDWNLTFGDPADDLDYILTNNHGSQAFREIFLAAYQPNPGTGDVIGRMSAYTLKNRLDDLAWTIERCRKYPGKPEWRTAYHERIVLLEQAVISLQT